MKSRKTDIHSRILRVAALLLVLVSVTASIVSGRYARYVTSASFSDGARVARFHIQEEFLDGGTDMMVVFSGELSPGEMVEREIKVTNYSEVAVAYTINVDNVYGNLPLEFMVDGKPVPFTGELGVYFETGKTFTLQILWPGEKSDESYSGKVDLSHITLTASQID